MTEKQIITIRSNCQCLEETLAIVEWHEKTWFDMSVVKSLKTALLSLKKRGLPINGDLIPSEQFATKVRNYPREYLSRQLQYTELNVFVYIDRFQTVCKSVMWIFDGIVCWVYNNYQVHTDTLTLLWWVNDFCSPVTETLTTIRRNNTIFPNCE